LKAFQGASFEKKIKILSFICTEIFTIVFNILTINSSFLYEIQCFFIKMIIGKSSTKSDNMKSFLNALRVLWLIVDRSILQKNIIL
jgi:hypothetical protein